MSLHGARTWASILSSNRTLIEDYPYHLTDNWLAPMIDRSTQIRDFLHKHSWMHGKITCEFLAAGEYNENYLVSAAGKNYVFRINHGSQLGLANQIEYEFRVLEAVSSSGVTPVAHQFTPRADGLGKGVLLMEYLPGVPLDYEHDSSTAAEIFARIHALPVNHDLIIQANPARAIAAESLGLIRRYTSSRYRSVRTLLLDYHEQISRSSDEMARLYADEPLAIVNTEVNSGNFRIDPARSCLVDWEKAVISHRYQDLAHFLVPTTTLWKTTFRFTEQGKQAFLESYLACSDLKLSVDEVYEKTRRMERVILLRALSWCYMAYHEYTSTTRELTHDDTFATITSYLDQAECFLR